MGNKNGTYTSLMKETKEMLMKRTGKKIFLYYLQSIHCPIVFVSFDCLVKTDNHHSISCLLSFINRRIRKLMLTTLTTTIELSYSNEIIDHLSNSYTKKKPLSK